MITCDEMKQIVKDGYNLGKYAKYYGRNDKLTTFEKQYFDSLIDKLPKESNILDLGCGTGLPFDSYLIANGHNVTGIDLAENHIKLAKDYVAKGTYIAGDYTKYKFNNNSFNSVISLYSIFHLPRNIHESFIKMIHEYLVKDGYLLITMGADETDNIEVDYDFCGNVKMAWSNYGLDKNIEIIINNGFDIIKYDNEADFGSDESQIWILAKKI